MVNNLIKKIRGRQVFDSRGNPTIEVEVTLNNDINGKAIAPSGASKGKLEAIELRDNDRSIYNGMSVIKATNIVNNLISKKLKGINVENQEEIDKIMIELDGTPNKKVLGANTIIATSMAVSVTAAKAKEINLFEYLSEMAKIEKKDIRMPLPIVQIIGGGIHGGWNIDIQDLSFIPIGFRTYNEAMEAVFSVRRETELILQKYGYEHKLVGDEGGIAPHLSSNEQALTILSEAMDKAGIKSRKEGGIGLDVAASQLHRNEKYIFKIENKSFSTKEMILTLMDWVEKYPIVSIEDGLSEDDWEGWITLTKNIGDKVQLIGDDLFVTSVKLLQKGIDFRCGNAILIKPNQVGTITETLKTLNLAKKNNFNTIVSARSGETEDSFIADFAVGTNAGQIKIGSIARSERLSKYNQLLRIEEKIDNKYMFKPKFGL